jgi:hypothetical protein
MKNQSLVHVLSLALTVFISHTSAATEYSCARAKIKKEDLALVMEISFRNGIQHRITKGAEQNYVVTLASLYSPTKIRNLLKFAPFTDNGIFFESIEIEECRSDFKLSDSTIIPSK